MYLGLCLLPFDGIVSNGTLILITVQLASFAHWQGSISVKMLHQLLVMYSLFRPQALDLHLWYSARYARLCLLCRSQLAGGMPPGPPGTHV